MIAHGLRDYSQSGEQATILEWAEAQQQAGSFVDLGCYDGEEYSNTAALADRGWPGVCVDAAPDASVACALRYAGREDIEVVCAAFTTDTTDEVTMHWAAGTMYTSLAGSKRTEVKTEPVQVPALNLAWFGRRVAELPTPRFASIDLEGSSLDALEWLLKHAELGCVCVEANNPVERRSVREMLAEGWAEACPSNPYNLIFARR